MLPSTISCRVSSEAAGYVTMSRVRQVEVPVHELLAKILGYCGKNSAKVAGILARGAMVSGEMRYRWAPVLVEEVELAAHLDRFPEHEPDRVFAASRCERIVLPGERGAVEISRDAGSQRRLLRRRAFWDDAVAILGGLGPRCERYSYSEGADVFVVDLTTEARDRLRKIASRLRFSTLEAQVRRLPAGRALLFTIRDK